MKPKMILAVGEDITIQNVEIFYRRKKVRVSYENVRKSKEVIQCFDEKIESLKLKLENDFSGYLDIIEEYYEYVIKYRLINQAIKAMLVNGNVTTTMEDTMVFYTLKKDNIINIIEHFRLVTNEQIEKFCKDKKIVMPTD